MAFVHFKSQWIFLFNGISCHWPFWCQPPICPHRYNPGRFCELYFYPKLISSFSIPHLSKWHCIHQAAQVPPEGHSSFFPLFLCFPSNLLATPCQLTFKACYKSSFLKPSSSLACISVILLGCLSAATMYSAKTTVMVS